MNSIGLRSSVKSVYYCISTQADTHITILNVSELVMPLALNIPERLHYLRNTLIDVLDEYQIGLAGIRTTETNSQNTSFERINMEGVIQELLSSSCIKNYFAGPSSTVTSILRAERTDFKKWVDQNEVPFNLDDWNTFNKEEKEAILTSIAAGRLQ